MAEPRWLSETEQVNWRAYMAGSTQLWEALDRDLKTGHGLTMAEYEILVRLSESPDRRLRMAELAESAYQSRSRLSHTCSRLESKGLVAREPCEDDKRGVNAILTEQGLSLLEAAARDHVVAVRAFFVDIVDPADLDAIGRAFAAVAERTAGSR
ncbi:MAG: MarR family transcriptional regulator [Streptosporangiaceae bacterium]